MPTFDTPEPISVQVDLVVGDVLILAGDRADTVVDVRPSDPSADRDVRTAEQTRVEYTDGRLLIRAPRQKKLGVFGKTGSVDVSIELPAGSRVRGDTAAGTYRCTGRLGECRLKTSAGALAVEHAGPVDLHTAAGPITVDRVDGDAEVTTSTGQLRLAQVTGNAVVKNSNGATRIGTVGGDLRGNAANGDIVASRVDGAVSAATANGDVRIDGIGRGPVSVKTARGELEIGVLGDAAVWLDLHTQFGTVHNRIPVTDAPGDGERTVEVRARTSFGDIIVRRG
ncbi:DUF4097 family beta strand repeat-containing protein [Micromonospora zhanjiangensis]|uniref:DUF4097 domain-containing protein n=1 Tax=Micromonospora zhanjiangensis TaxID=1522057 RepID=A0ABV8KWB0_9ACTN